MRMENRGGGGDEEYRGSERWIWNIEGVRDGVRK